MTFIVSDGNWNHSKAYLLTTLVLFVSPPSPNKKLLVPGPFIISILREGLKKMANYPLYVDKRLKPPSLSTLAKFIMFTLRNLFYPLLLTTHPLVLINFYSKQIFYLIIQNLVCLIMAKYY